MTPLIFLLAFAASLFCIVVAAYLDMPNWVCQLAGLAGSVLVLLVTGVL